MLSNVLRNRKGSRIEEIIDGKISRKMEEDEMHNDSFFNEFQ